MKNFFFLTVIVLLTFLTNCDGYQTKNIEMLQKSFCGPERNNDEYSNLNEPLLEIRKLIFNQKKSVAKRKTTSIKGKSSKSIFSKSKTRIIGQSSIFNFLTGFFNIHGFNLHEFLTCLIDEQNQEPYTETELQKLEIKLPELDDQFYLNKVCEEFICTLDKNYIDNLVENEDMQVFINKMIGNVIKLSYGEGGLNIYLKGLNVNPFDKKEEELETYIESQLKKSSKEKFTKIQNLCINVLNFELDSSFKYEKKEGFPELLKETILNFFMQFFSSRYLDQGATCKEKVNENDFMNEKYKFNNEEEKSKWDMKIKNYDVYGTYFRILNLFYLVESNLPIMVESALYQLENVTGSNRGSMNQPEAFRKIGTLYRKAFQTFAVDKDNDFKKRHLHTRLMKKRLKL